MKNRDWINEATRLEDPSGNWLQKRLVTLNALYQRYGCEVGLKDEPITDVFLLLSSKELQFRDVAKGRDLSETQKTESRHLELEIGDLTAYLKRNAVVLGHKEYRSYRQSEREQPDEHKKFSWERHRGRGGR